VTGVTLLPPSRLYIHGWNNGVALALKALETRELRVVEHPVKGDSP
jgi:hypothetical protein